MDQRLTRLRRHLPWLLESQGGWCPWHDGPLPKDLDEVEVDHIVPRSRGGSDELGNLQALCSRCNRQKGAGPMHPTAAWSPSEDPWVTRFVEYWRTTFTPEDIDLQRQELTRRLGGEAALLSDEQVMSLLGRTPPGLTALSIVSCEPMEWHVHHAWHAEAMKRCLAAASFEAGGGWIAPGCPFVSQRQMLNTPTWLWDSPMIHEWLQMPNPEDVELSLHPGVGVGIHFFRWRSDPVFKSEEVHGPSLEVDDDGRPVVTLDALVITPDGVATAFADASTSAQMEDVKKGWTPLRGYGRSGANLAANMTALLSQKLVAVSQRRAPRNLREPKGRRARRAQPLDPTAVNVVTYRRPSEIAEPNGLVSERDKHWWRRGHWVNQPCGPQGSQRRPVFRRPHPVGNLSAPLHVPRPTVNVVSR